MAELAQQSCLVLVDEVVFLPAVSDADRLRERPTPEIEQPGQRVGRDGGRLIDHVVESMLGQGFGELCRRRTSEGEHPRAHPLLLELAQQRDSSEGLTSAGSGLDSAVLGRDVVSDQSLIG